MEKQLVKHTFILELYRNDPNINLLDTQRERLAHGVYLEYEMIAVLTRTHHRVVFVFKVFFTLQPIMISITYEQCITLSFYYATRLNQRRFIRETMHSALNL